MSHLLLASVPVSPNCEMYTAISSAYGHNHEPHTASSNANPKCLLAKAPKAPAMSCILLAIVPTDLTVTCVLPMAVTTAPS